MYAGDFFYSLIKISNFRNTEFSFYDEGSIAVSIQQKI